MVMSRCRFLTRVIPSVGWRAVGGWNRVNAMMMDIRHHVLVEILGDDINALVHYSPHHQCTATYTKGLTWRRFAIMLGELNFLYVRRNASAEELCIWLRIETVCYYIRCHLFDISITLRLFSLTRTN